MRRWKEIEPRMRVRLAEVGRVSRLDTDVLKIELLILSRSRRVLRTKPITVNTFTQIRVKRTGPCGLPVCKAHLQARGPGVYVCRDHWGSWEHAA